MKDLLQQLFHGTPLTAAQTEAAFTDIMDGVADPAQTAALLTLLATQGGGEPTIDELTGAATVMRRHVIAIDAPDNVVDTCGTGGVGSNYFNISTAAALVAAAAGVPVCKHGNRSVTSRSGSSDVLRALGVNIDTSPIQEAHCLKTANVCFAFAPKHHPAMKHVATIRQSLGFSTIFNILGPLTNPAGARRQVVGTRSPELADKLLEVLIRLGAQRALVVAGNDPNAGPLCEISISADTHIAEFAADRGGSEPQHRRYRIRPSDIGLRTHAADSSELQIRSPEESASRIRQVLTGLGTASRDIVLANAAAALWVGGAVHNLAGGVQVAAKTIDSGAAHHTLEALIAASHAAL